MIRTAFHRAVIVCLLLAGLFPCLHATHQKAAELIVEHVSGYTYRAKLYTYTYTLSDVDRPLLEIAWGDGNTTILERSRTEELDNNTKLNYYEGTHTYAGPGSYTLYMEDPNRNSGVVNVPNSVLTYMYISTTITISPWLGSGNDSPVTTRSPVDDQACLGRRYEHNPGAYDPDGDSLSYRLIPCRGQYGEEIPGYTYPAASDTIFVDPVSGTLVWDAPMAQGEYNAAILIEEWRNQIKIGEVTRDMQIIVRACDNEPPYIECEGHYCVEAGQTMMFPVRVFDNGRNALSLELSGEITQGGNRAGIMPVHEGLDSSVYMVYWNTGLADSRLQDYVLYLRAEDDGDPSLSSVKVVDVKVMAPSVHFKEPDVREEGFSLSWTTAPSPHASGYDLYRRDFYGEEAVYDSCQTGIGDTAYRLLASLPLSDSSYSDTDVEQGREYCYRVVSRFADGDGSRQSDALCLQFRNTSPLLTRASVVSTDSLQGRVSVAWRAPSDRDTSLPAGMYHLYSGIDPDSLSLRASFPFADSCTYVDSALNTLQHAYCYQVVLDSSWSSPASTPRLEVENRTARIRLRWESTQPWINTRYDIYRFEDSVGDFRLLASTKETVYDDQDVETGKEYLYYVRSVGSYFTRTLPDTLYNNSNMARGWAEEGLPCQPYLALAASSCQPLSSTLVWDFDSLSIFTGQSDTAFGSVEREECEASVAYYELYRKQASDDEYVLLATLEEKEYEDTEPGSLFCWYRVVGVNASDVPGEASNEVFVDNWNCFSFNLPDVFTPNGDQWNETWTAIDPLYIEKFSLKVVNRWGVTVFTSDDPGFEWNGRINNRGAACPDGVYYYLAEFEARAEGRVFKKVQSGSVTILR